MTDETAGRTKQRAAFHYGGPGALPPAVAAGSEALQRRVLELAKQHGIPIQESETLSQLLQHLPKESAVPAECYRIIAEVVSFLFKADCEFREQNSK